MSESELQQLIQIDGPQWGCFLLRNNSGAFEDKEGRVVRFGLGHTSRQHSDRIKSSDLVGFTQITIGPEHIGRILAVITVVECKHPDWKPSPSDKREKAQRAFIEWIKAKGGFGGFAWSLESFRKILGRL